MLSAACFSSTDRLNNGTRDNLALDKLTTGSALGPPPNERDGVQELRA
jgi:hypothetical protein